MRVLGYIEKDISKDKNGENVPKLEITEVVLSNCKFVDNNYQQTWNVLMFSGDIELPFYQTKCLDNWVIFHHIVKQC